MHDAAAGEEQVPEWPALPQGLPARPLVPLRLLRRRYGVVILSFCGKASNERAARAVVTARVPAVGRGSIRPRNLCFIFSSRVESAWLTDCSRLTAATLSCTPACAVPDEPIPSPPAPVPSSAPSSSGSGSGNDDGSSSSGVYVVQNDDYASGSSSGSAASSAGDASSSANGDSQGSGSAASGSAGSTAGSNPGASSGSSSGSTTSGSSNIFLPPTTGSNDDYLSASNAAGDIATNSGNPSNGASGDAASTAGAANNAVFIGAIAGVGALVAVVALVVGYRLHRRSRGASGPRVPSGNNVRVIVARLVGDQWVPWCRSGYGVGVTETVPVQVSFCP